MAEQNDGPIAEKQSAQTKKLKFTITTIAAYSVAVLGIVLISVSGLYIYSQSRSGSDIAEFVYSVPDESLDTHLGIEAEPPRRQPLANNDQPIPLELKSPDVAQFANLYPGDLLNPKYWSEPEWAG